MKQFTEKEAEAIEQVIALRRDVRGNRFIDKPIPTSVLERILNAAIRAPSVGFSQPWEFIVVTEHGTKKQIHQLFEQSNAEASQLFDGKEGEMYPQLKLEGILEAPINLAVFYKQAPKPVLGQTAMPDMGRYSVACAIQNMWLMSRALNVGMGWVSIINPEKVKNILNVPQSYELIGYMCLGYVDYFYENSELETIGWSKRKPISEITHFEKYTDG